jgi:hypothetical protein
MPAFVNASNVRSFAGIDGITGVWSEANLGSNIRTASSLLQRWTGRQFEFQAGVTKKFTTHGDSYIAIPDLKTASVVTLHESSQTADSDYFLVPDTLQTGVYLGVQFAAYAGRGGYRSHADWFDRNLDRYLPRTVPNNLVITGDWGHDPLPDDLLYATKALAAFLTKNPDALLTGFTATPDGTLVEAGDLPKVVASFISTWKVGNAVVSM